MVKVHRTINNMLTSQKKKKNQFKCKRSIPNGVDGVISLLIFKVIRTVLLSFKDTDICNYI